MQAHIFFTKDYTMEEFWDYKEDESYTLKKWLVWQQKLIVMIYDFLMYSSCFAPMNGSMALLRAVL